jgi:hypothetical protein
LIKRTPKEKRLRGKCNCWQKSVKTEQHVKNDFFENLMFLKSKSANLMKFRQKITENKIWVISQEVLFFNAFQLGAENRHQVLSSEEASRSMAEIFSTRHYILSI